VDGSRTVGFGRTRGVIVLVGEVGWIGEDGASEGARDGESDGGGEVRCLEKLRKLVTGRDREKGEMVDAREEILLLRPVMLKEGVVLAVQKLLLRVLLPVEDDDREDDELVPLLILRILENALLLLLTGGLDVTVISSRQICDSGAA
jgi:hypothetical protein